jgi:hypothetical protein
MLTADQRAGLAKIEKITAIAPQLDQAARAEYDRIFKRLHRAEGAHRSAKKHGDAKKIASAERSLARAKAARDAFVAPHVAHLHAPEHIICKFENRWSGPGVAGNHLHECEMVLDHKDLSGPEYRTVRVLKDEGGPPTNPRSAPTSMGVAWFALDEYLQSGRIVVLDAKELSTLRDTMEES